MTEPANLSIPEAAAAPDDEAKWAHAPLGDLIRHIVGKHHEYLKLEFPRISRRLDEVMTLYGDRDKATLAPLPGLFAGLHSELDLHMHKEEMVLFPFIERYEFAVRAGYPTPPVPFGTVANPIAMMEREHDSAFAALAAMRESTKDYAMPAHASETYRSLFQGLRELEEDLRIHIHLENDILFPRAIALESAGR